MSRRLPPLRPSTTLSSRQIALESRSVDNELLSMRAAAINSKVNEARWSQAAMRAHKDAEELIRVAKEHADARAAAEQQAAQVQDENIALQQRVADLEQWQLRVEETLKASGIVMSQPAAHAESKQADSEQMPEQTVPITYLEAFEAIGGMAKLAQYLAVSKAIEKKVSNPELVKELKELLPRDYERRTGFSTKLINQHYVRTLEELYAQARAIYPSFDAVIRQLASKTNGEALIPPMKGDVRARMKALFKCVLRAANAPAMA